MNDNKTVEFSKKNYSRGKSNTAPVTSPSQNFGLRVPPHSGEAEESIIGGILLDNEAMNDALEIVRSDDFYRPANVTIFKAMTSLVEKGEPVDIVTLANELKVFGSFDLIGGYEYLSKVASIAPSAANVSFYSRIVKDFSLRRRVIHEASQIIDDAFIGEGSVADFIDTVEQRMLGVASHRTDSSFSRVGEIVQSSIKIIETLYDRKESVTGIHSGFNELDKMTAGFQPSDLIIVAARPSMGKTSLALGIGSHVGLKRNGAVAIFSLEMSKEQLVLRMLCSEAAVDTSRVRVGNLAASDFPNLVNTAGRIADSQIYIDDSPAQTPSEIRAKCRRLNREHKLSLVIIDYLQLMRNPAYLNSREQEISSISRSLKALAKELQVPVVALSQLNRSVESRNDKRPLMSDLRESGAIEQDADIIMFIYRDEVYNAETLEAGIAEIIISKQRNGPTGTVKLAFSPSLTRFDNLMYEDSLPPGISFKSSSNNDTMF
jgi:replicative DNA helicase